MIAWDDLERFGDVPPVYLIEEFAPQLRAGRVAPVVNLGKLSWPLRGAAASDGQNDPRET
jgi:hypothetical protein